MTLTLYSVHVLARSRDLLPDALRDSYLFHVLLLLGIGAVFAATRTRGPLEALVGAASRAVAGVRAPRVGAMTTRWGIAGTGAMAEVFLPDFEHVPDAEVVAIGSRSRERAAAFAASYGIEGAHTYGELVARRHRRPLRRHPAPAAPRAGPGRDRGRRAGAGREGVHRDPGRRPRGRGRRPRAGRLLHGGDVDAAAAGRRGGPAARRGRRDRRGGRRPGRPRRPPRLRPRLPPLRPRARRRRDPRPRGLPHLVRPGLPRHPRPRRRLRDALPQRHRRVGDDAPGVRRRARRLAGLRAHHREPRAAP